MQNSKLNVTVAQAKAANYLRVISAPGTTSINDSGDPRSILCRYLKKVLACNRDFKRLETSTAEL